MLLNSQGRQIELGKRIGGGGEGDVFALKTDPNTVAKLYHSDPPVEKVAKLRSMVAAGIPELTRLACWPTDLVTEAAGRRVRGFLMPTATGGKEAHLLYSPKSRTSEFVSVQWPFLIAAAANMARAFAVVHRNGHVIGDVNHSSVFISPNATVRLIDCDSFQIRAGSELFRCEVGVPECTPPELQGKSLTHIERTTNHDGFGLAVLIFQLLYMGRHPFGGQFTGQGDLTLEDKISRFLFAFGPGASGRNMRQPPYTLGMDGVTPRVAELFEVAFGSKGVLARPTATDWVGALDELRVHITACKGDPAHAYYSALSSCPWCPIESKLGFSLFSVQFAPVALNAGFNLSLVWESIQKVQPPVVVQPLMPADSLPRGTPSEPFVEAGKKRRQRLTGIGVSAAATAIFAIYSLPSALLPLSILIFSLYIWWPYRRVWNSRRYDAQMRIRKLTTEYNDVRRKHDHWADCHVFREAFSELESAKQTLLSIPGEHKSKAEKLRAQAETILKKQFLNQFPIRPGEIPGFGPSRCADLQFYNIDTAADLDWFKVQQVPGIGPSRAADLMAWRQSLELRFRFNPASIVKTPDYQRMESEFRQLQARMEGLLSAGTKRLRDLATQTEAHRTLLEPQINDLATKLSDARADLAALG